jgi:hypothetical protein
VAGGLVRLEDDSHGCFGTDESVRRYRRVRAVGVVLAGDLWGWSMSLCGGVEGTAARAVGGSATSTSTATSEIAATAICTATTVGAAGCGMHGFGCEWDGRLTTGLPGRGELLS